MGNSSDKTGPGEIFRLSVASYNIHRCVGTDRLYLPRRTAEVIRGVGAEVIGLQEIDSRMPAGPAISQLDFLALVTGYRPISGPCFEDELGCFGNALFTRLPVLSTRLHDLSVRGREPRGIISAVLEFKGAEVKVLVTHLGRRGRERRQQVSRLRQVIHEDPARLTILLGDFNEWLPQSRCSRSLKSCFGRRLRRPTYPSLLPLFSLDHIWILPGTVKAAIRVYSTPLAQLASDHLPIQAEIEWSAGEVAQKTRPLARFQG